MVFEVEVEQRDGEVTRTEKLYNCAGECGRRFHPHQIPR